MTFYAAARNSRDRLGSLPFNAVAAGVAAAAAAAAAIAVNKRNIAVGLLIKWAVHSDSVARETLKPAKRVVASTTLSQILQKQFLAFRKQT